MPKTPPRLKGLGLARARSQAGLVAAVWAVLVACATVSGTFALLLTAGNDRALAAAVAQADGSADSGSPDVTTVVVLATGSEESAGPFAATFVPAVRDALSGAAGSYDASVTTWTTTRMLYLPGESVRRGYLLDAATASDNATLVAGEWPLAAGQADQGDDVIDVAIPSTTAAALAIGVGDTLTMAAERGDLATEGSYELRVVGVFEPSGSAAWDRDTLRGEGYSPRYEWLPAYGPFLVAPGALETIEAPLDTVTAVLDPDLAGDATGVPDLLRGIAGIEAEIEAALGADARPAYVRSGLGAAFAEMRAELSLTNSLVFAVLLVVVGLGMATVALVAKALARRRTGESTLLRDRGASTTRLAGQAGAEAGVLALVAAAVAVPASLGAYGLVASSSAWGQAWAAVAADNPSVSLGLLAAVGVGAAAPAALLVITALPQRARRARSVLSGPVASSGLDLMLALVAAVTFLQLRSHTFAPGAVDPLLAAAPAVCAVSVAALASRLLPAAARFGDKGARRGKGLTFPLAGWHVARGGAAHGTFLVVFAAAVTALGVTFLATWSVSQADQAEAIVGTEMAVHRGGGPGTGAELADAAGGTLTPIVDNAVVFGTRPEGVRLVAVPAAEAGAVLRGRLPGGATWVEAMSGLAPAAQAAPVAIEGDSMRITVEGGRRARDPQSARPLAGELTATPTFVLEDAYGSRATWVGSEVVLDGKPHAQSLPAPGQPRLPEGEWSVVAIDVLLAIRGDEDLISWGNTRASAELSIAIEGATATGGEWDATSDGDQAAVSSSLTTATGEVIHAEYSFVVLGLSWEEAHLTLLSFPASTEVPVAVSKDIAAEWGLAEGDRIAVTVGSTAIDAIVARTVDYVPSRVRQPAVLADYESYGRAMLSAGYLGSPVDSWWITGASDGSEQAIREAGWGPVTTLAEQTTELRDGPLRLPLRVAWLLTVGAAMAFAVVGAAAHATSEAAQRASTIARLRALGVPRKVALTSHLLQHGFVTIASVAIGALAGGVLAWALAPLLVVAPGGARAIPAAVVVWAWPTLTGALGIIAVAALAVGVPAAASMVRRSTVAALRSGDAS